MLHEQDIIQRIGQLTGQPEDLADDAYWDPNTRQIFTTDMLVEGHHFKQDYFSPEDIGWKAAAVNISDIAGMGGLPQSMLISLGLPENLELSWIDGFYQGFLAACKQYGCKLIGGDTVGSDQLVINVTAIGHCPEKHHVGRRNQAQAGDIIIATGYHGLSAVGLQDFLAKETNYPASQAAHLRPQPRLAEGQELSKRFSRYALMDSSDGLADAALKIALASKQKLILNSAKIPIHPEVRAYAQANALDPLQITLYGGEDFQLVAAVPEVPPELMAHFKVIGRVEAADDQPGAWIESPDNDALTPLSLEKTYQHFSGKPGHDAESV